MADGREHDVAVRFMKNVGWTFYVDGKADFKAKGNSKDEANQYFKIGASAGWAGPAFSGTISCFKYSTTAKYFD